MLASIFPVVPILAFFRCWTTASLSLSQHGQWPAGLIEIVVHEYLESSQVGHRCLNKRASICSGMQGAVLLKVVVMYRGGVLHC